MIKSYILPSGAELLLNHKITSPANGVRKISTEFRLNDEYFGSMTAYNGTVADLKKVKCFELEMFLKRSDTFYCRSDEKFTAITDVKIERHFIFERQTYYIFDKLFRYIYDTGFSSQWEAYLNLLLIDDDIVDDEIESIHRTLMLGLHCYRLIQEV